MLKAILFDAGGTIHTQKPTEATKKVYMQHLMEELNRHGVLLGESPDAVYHAVDVGSEVYKAYSDEYHIELPADQIWTDYHLAEFTLPKEKLAGVGQRLSFIFDYYRKENLPRPDLNEAICALHERGYKLGMLSNILSRMMIPFIVKEYGISQYMDYHILSSECMLRKPGREIFDYALETMGLTADEVIYVGDTISRDVIGTQNAGWKIIQMINKKPSIRDTKFLDMGYTPDYTIHSLSEIIPIVDSINAKEKEGASSHEPSAK